MPPLRMYDFQCSEDHIFEALVEDPKELVSCPKCASHSNRIISPIRSILDPLSFPTAESKWIKEHEKAGRKNNGSL
jgi:putative FmdB family regulatory protein